jgi:hypothetical protein
MQSSVVCFLMAILSVCLVACDGDDSSKSVSEKKAEEQSQRNPIKKGRYVCYYLSPAGDKIAPELYILSDNLYQVNDSIGHYKYHHKNSEIEWIDGPFYKSLKNWAGFYTAKGTATSGGGQTLESMIEIESQKRSDGKWPKVMHCNCAEFE